MTWQELKSMKEAGENERGFLKAHVVSRDGEEYDVNVIQGAISPQDLKRASEALKDGKEVYMKINFKRHPHPTAVKIGSWD